MSVNIIYNVIDIKYRQTKTSVLILLQEERRSKMEGQVLTYVKPELIVVAIALYFIGIGLKRAEIVNDRFIPGILGITGIIICGIYVVATTNIHTEQEAAMALFTAIVQGILVAGLSVYGNQLIKQNQKEE